MQEYNPQELASMSRSGKHVEFHSQLGIIYVCVYLTTLSVTQTTWRRMIGWTVNNELERIWAKADAIIISAFAWKNGGKPRLSTREQLKWHGGTRNIS
jgi:hypothetical protein